MVNELQKILIAERRKQLERAGITRRRLNSVIAKHAPEPRAAGLRYSRYLKNLQRQVNQKTREQIAPLLKTILAMRQDSLTDDTDAVFRAIAEVIKGILDPGVLRVGFSQYAGFITAFNVKKYDKLAYRLLGIVDLPSETERTILNSWVTENLQLIKNVNSEQVAKLQTMFYRAARDGTRAGTLNAEVSKIMKSSVKRATLIARDQTSKLSGQLDQRKQANAGITHYFWRTSLDERVRKQHEAREGKRFSWANPPPGGHPGQAIRCRCTAEPDIDAVLGKAA